MAPPVRDIPHPFAGWLEEHPEGGFRVFHEDGSSSPLFSYGEVVACLERVDAGELAPIVEVDRVRRAIRPGSDVFSEPKLPPPDDEEASA